MDEKRRRRGRRVTDSFFSPTCSGCTSGFITGGFCVHLWLNYIRSCCLSAHHSFSASWLMESLLDLRTEGGAQIALLAEWETHEQELQSQIQPGLDSRSRSLLQVFPYSSPYFPICFSTNLNPSQRQARKITLGGLCLCRKMYRGKCVPITPFICVKLQSPQWQKSSILNSWHSRENRLAAERRKEALLQLHTLTNGAERKNATLL